MTCHDRLEARGLVKSTLLVLTDESLRVQTFADCKTVNRMKTKEEEKTGLEAEVL